MQLVHVKVCLCWKLCCIANFSSVMQSLSLKTRVTALHRGTFTYIGMILSVQMSLSCTQSKFVLLSYHIWSIFNLEQQTAWNRLIVCSMVGGKLCAKEHSTTTVRRKNTNISSLKAESFISCLPDWINKEKNKSIPAKISDQTAVCHLGFKKNTSPVTLNLFSNCQLLISRK